MSIVSMYGRSCLLDAQGNCSGSIRCSIRSGMIRAFKNSRRAGAEAVAGVVDADPTVSDRGYNVRFAGVIDAIVRAVIWWDRSR
jgi:hypothetical protein